MKDNPNQAVQSKAKAPTTQSKFPLLLITTVIIAVIIITGYLLIRHQAAKDIMAALVEEESIKYSEEVLIHYEEFHISLRHGVYVFFDVVGDSQINNARWTLYPYREVMLCK